MRLSLSGIDSQMKAILGMGILILGLATGLGIQSCRASRLDRKATALEEEAKKHGTAAEEHTQKASDALGQGKLQAGVNEGLRTTRDQAARRLPPVPKPITPLPTSPTAVVIELQSLGLPNTVEAPPGAITQLAPEAAVLILTWGRQASRVPGLEARIQADQVLHDANDRLVTGLTTERDHLRTATAEQGAALDARTKEAGGYKQANVVLHKEVQILKGTTKTKVMVGFTLGALVVEGLHQLLKR